MTAATSPVKALMGQLASTGFTRPFIKSIMPEWWDASLEQSQQSVMMLKMHMAKHLGLDLAALMQSSPSVQFQNLGMTHYRLTRGKSEDDVRLAQTLAVSAARLVAAATTTPYKPISDKPAQIRQMIHRDHAWVGFQSLLDYCWKHGIPVLHLKNLPRNVKRFDGMVADVDGRPVIVLARNEKAPSWLLFILAHEVGHIGRGHVQRGSVYVDETVDASGAGDDKEQEATAYGMHILTGHAETEIRSSFRLNAEELARQSEVFAEQRHVDPGHVALNYGYTARCMQVARGALKLLPDQYNAMERVTEVMYQHIDLDLLPSDSRTVLERVM